MTEYSNFRGKVFIPPGRIAALAETHSPAEIADRLGMDEEEVIKSLEASGRKVPKLVLRCQKSRREWPVRSERGGYRKAQLLGLTTYTIEPARAQE